LRSDARLNQQKILEAARDVFAELGIEAPLERVARRANVGIATLYRRYPTREALLAAAFLPKMESWADFIEIALAQPDPCTALVSYLESVFAMQLEDRGFTDVLSLSFPEASSIEAARERGLNGFIELVQRSKSAECLRADFVPEDLLFFLMANAGVIHSAGVVAPEATRRLLSYFLQAIGVREVGPLSASPSTEAARQAMRRMPHSAVATSHPPEGE